MGSQQDQWVGMTVPGTGVEVYAHRSQTVEGAVLVGVDADDGQRLLLVVNEWDALDTTPGESAGSVAVRDAGGDPAVSVGQVRFCVPQAVVGAGEAAVRRWVGEQAESIATAYSVDLDVEVGAVE